MIENDSQPNDTFYSDYCELVDEIEITPVLPEMTHSQSSVATTSSFAHYQQSSPDDENEKSPSPVASQSLVSTKKTTKKRKQSNHNDHILSDSLDRICKLAEEEEMDDEDTYFAKSIAKQMKNMNDELKFQFKIKILQLAHEAVKNSKQ